MTQKEQLLQLFVENGNVLTLRQILNTTLCAEYRARISELRKSGYKIEYSRGHIASDNLYQLKDIQKELWT